MTDNEIIRHLEALVEMAKCSRLNFPHECLDLINRQQAEIERFRKNDSENFAKWNELAERTINHYEELFQVAKDAVREKAIKEFAERLKHKFVAYSKTTDGLYSYNLSDDDIDRLVKEMVGDTE